MTAPGKPSEDFWKEKALPAPGPFSRHFPLPHKQPPAPLRRQKRAAGFPAALRTDRSFPGHTAPQEYLRMIVPLLIAIHPPPIR